MSLYSALVCPFKTVNLPPPYVRTFAAGVIKLPSVMVIVWLIMHELCPVRPVMMLTAQLLLQAAVRPSLSFFLQVSPILILCVRLALVPEERLSFLLNGLLIRERLNLSCCWLQQVARYLGRYPGVLAGTPFTCSNKNWSNIVFASLW